MVICHVASYSIRHGRPPIVEENFPHITHVWLDVRTLQGPRKNLRKYNGTHKDVAQDILKRKENQTFLEYFWDRLQGYHEAYTDHAIYIGCEKGMHRSLVLAIAVQEKYNLGENQRSRYTSWRRDPKSKVKEGRNQKTKAFIEQSLVGDCGEY